MARFIIPDPDVKSYAGHHYEYDVSVCEAAVARKYEGIIITHKNLKETEQEGIRFIKRFRHTLYENKHDAYRAELMDALRPLSLKADDHIFIPTIYPPQLLQVFAAMVFEESLRQPQWHIMLRRPLAELDRVTRNFALFNALRVVSDHPEIRDRLTFYTDTKQLQEEYLAFFKPLALDIHVLPIPHRLSLAEMSKKRKKNAPLTLSYMGDARTEKGYAWLPHAVADTLARYQGEAPLRFLLHSHFNLPGGEPGIAPARALLRKIDPKRVETPEGPFSPDEYYAHLAETDIMLLPYSETDFDRRSSSVCTETIRAGKVAVVNAGTWLADQIDASRGVVFKGRRKFADGILEAIGRFPELSANAQAYAKDFRQFHDPAVLVDLLLAKKQKTPVDVGNGRRVLYLLADWQQNPFSGSHRAMINHLAYLHGAGYTIDLLVYRAALSPIGTHEFASYNERFIDLCQRFRIGRTFQAWFPSEAPLSRPADELAVMAVNSVVTCSDFAGMTKPVMMRSVSTISPPDLKKIKDTRYDFIFMNHAYNLALLDKYGIDTSKVICDTHDIQSDYAAVINQTERDQESWALELSLLQRCKGLIFVNSVERNEVKSASKKMPRSEILFPSHLQEEQLSPAGQLAGIASLVEVYLASLPVDRGHANGMVPRFKDENSIDLLYLTSGHTPNVMACKWFLEAVYHPYLEMRDTSLYIAGAIDIPGYLLRQKTFQLGAVDDTGPLYAAAKIVVVPFVSGTGVPVKLLDALARGKPVVASREAFAAFGDLADEHEDLMCDDGKSMALRILELLNSLEERQRCARSAAELAQKLMDWPVYVEKMRGLMEEGLPGITLPFAGQAQRFTPPHFLEWNEEYGLFNVLLRNMLLERPMPPQIAHYLRQRLADPQFGTVAESMFHAFFVAQKSPFAKLLKRDRFFTDKITWRGESYADFLRHLSSHTN